MASLRGRGAEEVELSRDQVLEIAHAALLEEPRCRVESELAVALELLLREPLVREDSCGKPAAARE